jgi:hypothetical protein
VDGFLQVPSEHLDQLWADYERFETASAGRNNLAAVRFVDEARPQYHTSKEAWAKRSILLAALDHDALPWQPGLSPPSSAFAEQRNAWQAYVDFERSNQQSLDAGLWRKRVNLAFRQALQPLAGCPEVLAFVLR